MIFRIPCIVDFAWVFNHLLIGVLIYVDFYNSYSINFLNSDDQNKNILAIIQLILLVLWFIRLGGFIFINRVIKAHLDARYEELAKGKN